MPCWKGYRGTFELQNRFVADVAHELRTPLATLRTNLEVVASDPQADLEDYRAMAVTQERALTRLERLVADLLILATTEQQQPSEAVTLASLLEFLIRYSWKRVWPEIKKPLKAFNAC